jgi:hypothetical protein
MVSDITISPDPEKAKQPVMDSYVSPKRMEVEYG